MVTINIVSTKAFIGVTSSANQVVLLYLKPNN